MSLFAVSQTLPFGVAAVIMLGLAVVEVFGLFLATSPSHALESTLPEGPEGVGGALGWLHVGRVPLLVLVILFLFGFSVTGYGIQISVQQLFGFYLPAFVAAIPALFAGIGVVRLVGSALAQVIPKDETTAVSSASFIGRSGMVITGTARLGQAAEAKVRDQFGNMHYLMVEPDLAEEEIEQGTEILIVSKAGSRYRAIRNPHSALTQA